MDSHSCARRSLDFVVGAADAMTPLEPTVVRPALRDEAMPGTRRVPAPSIRAMVEVDPQAACQWEQAFDEMPEVGDRFFDFELIDTLGEGAFGQVFLARQGDLADRLVALKISADLLDEPAKLAYRRRLPARSRRVPPR